MEIKIIRRKEKDGDQDYKEEREGWSQDIRRKEKDGDQDYQQKGEGCRSRLWGEKVKIEKNKKKSEKIKER